MSEYWKSTPKYWCKHCSVYVRDTKLERANHEATGKHQGAVKRSLRELHRNAEQQDREKERARREVERLNGVVSGAAAARPGTKAPPQQVSQAERQKQLEQLAELGVNIPTELRSNMAMAGEWTVTSTRVIAAAEEKAEDKGPVSLEGLAVGVKRRGRTDEEKEQEDAIKGLFKKPRRWGVDSKTMPADEDAELEALLSGPLVKTKKEESAPSEVVKKEDGREERPQGDAAEPTKEDESPPIKKELDKDVGPALALTQGGPANPPSGGTEAAEGAAVMFKKRKPKNIRQK